MKLKPLASNMTEVEVGDFTILFSYQTPVACHEAGVGVSQTEHKWSATTTRHINKWMNTHGFVNYAIKPQSFFDNLISF